MLHIWKRVTPRFYINYISILFFLVYGIVMLDASGITYFSDVLMSELAISTSQYSALNSAVWCTKAISSILVGIIADRTGLRKKLLVPLLITAGVLSIWTGLTNSFASILILRFLWGMCVGSTLSMLISIASKCLAKNDFGFRSGFISSGSAVIASTLGPIILTTVVLQFSWRAAFFLTGALLVFFGALIQLSVDEVKCLQTAGTLRGVVNSFKVLIKNRTFLICLLIGIFECAGKLAITIFAPLYLTETMGISTELKGTLLAVMGLVYIPISFFVPALADHFPGRLVMAITFVFCLIAPAAMIFFEGTIASVVCLVIFGNWAAATVSIFIYLLPGQALPENLIGTANGLIMGVSVFFGGCVFPIILGKLAESVNGLRTVMIVGCVLFVACILLSLFLKDRICVMEDADV